jgi:hypothetical protein
MDIERKRKTEETNNRGQKEGSCPCPWIERISSTPTNDAMQGENK